MNIKSAHNTPYKISPKIYPSYIKTYANTTFCGNKLITRPVVDSFTHTDKSLSSKFLKGLLDVFNENISETEKLAKIKNKFLIAMGYNHPEQLKIIFINSNNDCSTMSFNPILGYIGIHKIQSPAQTISELRHELEHMEQFIKIYKTKGKSAFLSALLNIIKQNHPDVIPDITTLSKNFNDSFYKSMSKDISINNFNSEEYYKAMYEYTNNSNAPSKAYKYNNNLLEKDAYDVSRKVLKKLGQDAVLPIDLFPKNYETLIKLLDERKISIKEQDNILQVMHIIACLKSIETPENIKKYLKIWSDISDNIHITRENKTFYRKIQKKLDTLMRQKVTPESVKAAQKRWHQVESWFRERKFYAEDIYYSL